MIIKNYIKNIAAIFREIVHVIDSIVIDRKEVYITPSIIVL